MLEPLQQLERAIKRLQEGDFSVRVANNSQDEFGTLATGFNELTAHLQSMYRDLETKVSEKTSELQEKGERLQALYDMKGFAQRVRAVMKADAVAVRWSGQHQQNYLLLASHGLSRQMIDEEQCVKAGDCRCALPQAEAGVRVIPVRLLPQGSLPHCAHADFETVVALPIRLHERSMGEVSLFYNA